MPQLGETVTEGTITRWLKQVGDTVAEDEVLFEVSTDKVDSEVPSPAGGVLAEILVPEGETVDVGTKLAVVTDAAGAPAAEQAAQPAPAEAPAAEEPAPAEEALAAEQAAQSAASAPAGAVAQVPPPPPGQASRLDQQPAPSGSRRPGDGNTRPADQRPPSAPGGGAKVLSPVVRRLISEYRLDPNQITGTGAGGRITRSDVLALIDRQSQNGQDHPAAAAPAQSAAAPAQPTAERPALPATARASEAVAAGERDTVIPFTNIRRRTAEHMVRSKHTSAHTMVAVEVDYHKVEQVRQAARSHFKAAEGFSLTFLPFIARAVVDAIAEWPQINSSVGDDQLVVHNDINLGIAVDVNFEGLLVPVIHQADGKRLVQLAREISSLAGKARAKKLTMDDISGGTFTITNAGPFGTLMTVAVINQPQVAILSTDGVRKKPVAVELPDGSDGIVVHPVGNLVMSWDHRAVDGAYAAAFLANIKEILETRDWAVEL